MPRHKKDTLVRAFTKEEVGKDKWDSHNSEEYVEPHGYLWIVQRWIPVKHLENEHDRAAYECRSLADGFVTQLFPTEITARRK